MYIYRHKQIVVVMRYKYLLLLCGLLLCVTSVMGQRHFTVVDGLPTGEVRQIVELPNGQMLVNCEGVFCISNGHSFDVIPCDQSKAYKLHKYGNRYGFLWQGDSVLWLRDFYYIYRFDVRQRMFVACDDRRPDNRLRDSILSSARDTPQPTAEQQYVIDSLRVGDVTVATKDRQGGLWFGTRSNGIVYQPPFSVKTIIHTNDDPLIGETRGATQRNGQTMFSVSLRDGRILRCNALHELSYYLPEEQKEVSLNEKILSLDKYRYMVGACLLDDAWVVVYTQNGLFMLDTSADTLAPFTQAKEIERYSSKYNCMLKDRNGLLWVGTQNGLFIISKNKTTRVDGLANNCIRSLVMDADGHLWAGTSYGVSRVTPSIINLGTDDGIPAKSMMDRAADLTQDGRLVFVINGGQAVSFRPDELIRDENPLPVVLTKIEVNGEEVRLLPDHLSYNHNYLTFYFSTLNYATPSHDRYRYRLCDLERTWNVCSDGCGQVTVDYKALPPGDYCLEVQAASASGDWGPVTTLSFVISPPWWLTWWAKLIYVCLALIFACTLLFFYLKRKKAKMERENDDRVNRLFELREQARHQFAVSVNIDPDKVAVNAEEEKLVTQMLKAIEAHINDEQYNADLLARDIAMSRASLYKKMQTMLGITPTDFIRNVRLKRAAKMLVDSQLSISEIAALVGFATARNFSTQFKKMFGVLPSEYRMACMQNGSDNQ